MYEGKNLSDLQPSVMNDLSHYLRDHISCVQNNLALDDRVTLATSRRDSGRSQWPRSPRHEPSSPARTLGIVALNLTRGIYGFTRIFYVCVVLCIGRGLATGWSPVQGFLLTVYKIKKLKSRQGPTKWCRAIDKCWREENYYFFFFSWFTSWSCQRLRLHSVQW
jgi:hypothetical protein